MAQHTRHSRAASFAGTCPARSFFPIGPLLILVLSVAVAAMGGRPRKTAHRSQSFRRLGVCALALAFGCRSRGGEPAPLPERWRLALAPSAFPEALSLQQQVKVEQAGRTVDFDAVLDISAENVTLVGMAFSQRVFTLQYDGRKLEETRSRLLPKEVQGADVLSDLQLALWPAEAVRAALPAGWTLTDADSARVLTQGDSVRTSISYSGTPRWSGTISLDNRQYDYRLTVRSAVQR